MSFLQLSHSHLVRKVEKHIVGSKLEAIYYIDLILEILGLVVF